MSVPELPEKHKVRCALLKKEITIDLYGICSEGSKCKSRKEPDCLEK